MSFVVIRSSKLSPLGFAEIISFPKRSQTCKSVERERGYFRAYEVRIRVRVRVSVRIYVWVRVRYSFRTDLHVSGRVG